jgi:uncharacterized protein
MTENPPYEHELEKRLVALVRSSPVLMRALRAAREIDPPDWLIGAGAIRDLVWDHLHDSRARFRSKDIDLVFFDPTNLGESRERGVLAGLTAREPDIPWDVTNQAAVHLWYQDVFGTPVKPLVSSADGVGTWPETATSVAVRLLHDDSIELVAPCGLKDLFEMVCRRNPRRVTVEEYTRRIQRKQIAVRWPQVKIVR